MARSQMSSAARIEKTSTGDLLCTLLCTLYSTETRWGMHDDDRAQRKRERKRVTERDRDRSRELISVATLAAEVVLKVAMSFRIVLHTPCFHGAQH